MRGLLAMLVTAVVLVLLTAGKGWALSVPLSAVLVVGELLLLNFPLRRRVRVRGRRFTR